MELIRTLQKSRFWWVKVCSWIPIWCTSLNPFLRFLPSLRKYHIKTISIQSQGLYYVKLVYGHFSTFLYIRFLSRVFLIRVPCYFWDLGRDPNLESYPHAHLGQRVWFVGLGDSRTSGS